MHHTHSSFSGAHGDSERYTSKLSYAIPTDPWPRQLMIRAVERACGRRKLERIYERIRARCSTSQAFWPAALSELDISLDFNVEQLAKIPTNGPLI